MKLQQNSGYPYLSLAAHNSLCKYSAWGLLIVLAACGGGGGSDSSNSSSSNSTINTNYTVSGTVSGLKTSGLMLQLNSVEVITIKANSVTFSFSTPVNGSYSVKIVSQPSSETCTISNASGTSSINVSNVNVICSSQEEATSLTVRQIEVAQVLSQAVGGFDPYQSLVPSRKALVRAYLYAPKNKDGTNATLPVVNLLASGTNYTMTCPTQVSSTMPKLPIRSYALSDSCWVEIAASDVRSGMSLTVTADKATSTLSPTVSQAQKIDIVLVPLTINGKTTSIDSARVEKARAHITKHFPFATVNVTLRSLPVALEGGNNIGDFDAWSLALNTLENLRINESEGGKNKIYFGISPYTAVSGKAFIAGLGYCNDCGSNSSNDNFSSIGLDLPDASVETLNNWQRTMLHELGHNLSLMHVNCYGTKLSVSNIDYDYPHSGGHLGTAALYDEATKTLINPSSLTYNYDVMGYCKGDWLSDYHYRKIQNFTSRFTTSSNSATSRFTTSSNSAVSFMLADSATAQAGAWNLSGILKRLEQDVHQVSLSPINIAPSRYDNPPNQLDAVDSQDKLLLNVTTSTGRNLTVDVALNRYADSFGGNRPFFYRLNKIQDNEQITRLAFTYQNKTIPIVINSKNTSSITNRFSEPSDFLSPRENINPSPEILQVRVTQDSNQLSVQWDAGIMPWINVVWVKDNERLVLAINAQGGDFTAPINTLPMGGQWEITMSNGLQTHTILQP